MQDYDTTTPKVIPHGYCQCGCGLRPVSSASLYIRGHNPKLSRDAGIGDSDIRRFASKVDAADIDSCWEWQGSKGNHGYGRILWTGKNRPAHRVSYALFRGAIPEGYDVDHLCSNTECVNPYHLDAVTHTENIRRGAATILTEADAAYIREVYAPRSKEYGASALASVYGVSRNQIWRVVAGKNWND